MQLAPTLAKPRPTITSRWSSIVAPYRLSRFRLTTGSLLTILTLAEVFLARQVHLTGMSQLLAAWPGLLLLAVCLFYTKTRPLPRLVDSCEMAIWAVLASNLLALVIQIAARTSSPLVDAHLAALDHGVHFDTATIARSAARIPILQASLAFAYAALPVLVFAAILLPPVFGDARSSRQYVLAVLIATLFTAGLFAIFPACGPWTTEALHPSHDQAEVTARLMVLKSKAPAIIDLDHNAIVSFPSFHIVLALLSALALNKLSRVRVAAWTLVIPTCVSTITTGWHYGVDVLGGFAVTAAAWGFALLALPAKPASKGSALLSDHLAGNVKETSPHRRLIEHTIWVLPGLAFDLGARRRTGGCATIDPMPDDLSTQFQTMSDEEMLKLGGQYASLTDEAQSLVRSEFTRRNLEVPDAEEVPDTLESQTLRTIRRYRDQPEALLARSVLESSGIPCSLRDENTIRIEWIWSNYMGGIRLQVAESDAEAAEAILSQPIPAHIALEGQPDYDQPQCPHCGSLDVSFNNFDAKVGATSMLLFGFPLPSPVHKDYWHCNSCDTNWIDDTEAS